jgi:hypothetical protein
VNRSSRGANIDGKIKSDEEAKNKQRNGLTEDYFVA